MASVEDRITAIENDLAQLRVQLLAKHWVQRVSGSLKDFPEFEEILQLGQELRRRKESLDSSDSSGR